MVCITSEYNIVATSNKVIDSINAGISRRIVTCWDNLTCNGYSMFTGIFNHSIACYIGSVFISFTNVIYAYNISIINHPQEIIIRVS